MRKTYDIVIVGAGLGGLTSGALLAKQGKKVLVLEQHYIPGGCATTFKRKDYVMEVGLHEMDGLDDLDIKTKTFHELDIFRNIELLPIPEFYRYIDDEVDTIIPDNIERAIETLINKYPQEEKGIKKFFKVIRKIRREVFYLPRVNWLRILLLPLFPVLYPYTVCSSSKALKIAGLTNPLFWLLTPHLAFWKHRTIGSLLDRIIKDESLKKVLLANLTYYHDDPHSLSLIYFCVAQGGYFKGSYFIKGGSQNLSNHLVKIIEDNNGTVLLGKKVTDIIIENNKAVGVSYKDAFNTILPKKSVYSNAVIGNAAPALITKMLPEKQQQKMKNKYDSLQEACSLLSVYIGFKKDLKKMGSKHYSTFFGGDGVKTTKDILTNQTMSWDKKGFVFVDYSQLDSGLTPNGKSFGTICATDYLSEWENLSPVEYKKKKEQVAQVLFNRLEKHLPGIKNEIEYYEVGTPKTIQNYTSNPMGTAYGFAQFPDQAGAERIQIETSPIKQLYFSSAWGFPGGGFTGAITSGILCANKLKYLKTNKDISPVLEDSRIVKLISKNEISKNTIEITIEKPTSFEYKAGQYAVLNLLNPKHQELDIPIRPLSMVSHPDENVLRFAMRLSSSSYKKSVNDMKTGDQCRVFGPMGDFSVETNKKGIVFLVSGIGITPIMPFLKELEKNKFNQPIYLFYSNKAEENTAYHQHLKSVGMPNYKYVPVFTNTQPRIGKDMLIKELKELNNYDYYLVGTNAFTESMQQLLQSNNIKKENIKTDDFG